MSPPPLLPAKLLANNPNTAIIFPDSLRKPVLQH